MFFFFNSIAFCVLLSFLAVEKMLKNKDLELLQCSLGQESYCGNSKKNLNFGEVVVGANDFLWVCSPKMGLKSLLEMIYYSGFMAVLR